ncbi:hypothetical protein HBH56_051110 [Parastagonospora nodorum]|uniref:Uncharacterized protein n=1 Tax=Phaeosphaeria nodorum (strain SN15 / ATCC MYA-4574 / FGSC 10173) TaxID=321614 RepID=A0A7U2FB71_PHANO|nr:hypothetical protein HBH56_051110 [Parastagonospora nodorum]QRD02084.1 hypothetical protein JI435_050520 [Parastagonospora nodorum SN15]KAH3935463.1 hypothetical protein HBH54_036900 [Parastagonospora nodorum]KAH3997517.1 hypothetical protein HBI10_142680 [Parastagonospora nodorum]KAH4021066.1 hypothetical protein HBI13_110980 [Parastagonospora nodorum]
MNFCGLSRLLRVKEDRTRLQPTPIEIRARLSEDTETSRVAILSYDPTSNTNIISYHLATKILEEPIHTLDNSSTNHVRTKIHGEEIGGYVDLDWCFEETSKRWHTSRFFVTTTYDPPYDAVLGRRDAEDYGMLRSRSRR